MAGHAPQGAGNDLPQAKPVWKYFLTFLLFVFAGMRPTLILLRLITKCSLSKHIETVIIVPFFKGGEDAQRIIIIQALYNVKA